MPTEETKEENVSERARTRTGCFLLQRQFAHIGHAIACHLKESYGVERFCGYVYKRSSYQFLTTQKDFAYSTLLFDEEIHDRYANERLDPEYLSMLEQTYGLPSLWPVIAVDRVIMSNQLIREYPYDASPYTHEDMLRLLQVHAKAIIDMLERERPDFLVCSVLGAIGGLLLYHIARKKGIKIFFINTACLPDRFIFSECFERFTWVDEAFAHHRDALRNSPGWNEAERYLNAFRDTPIPYYKNTTPQTQPVTRRKQLKFLSPVNAFRSAKEVAKSIVDHYAKMDRYDYCYIGPWNYLRDMFKRKARNIIGLEDLYDEFNPTVDFAFFPLHYEPEVTLLLQAPFHTDQIGLIRQIARSLPVQYKLVVKEHPAMVEYRPRSFYRALKRIPNVVLVSPTISGFSITPYAKCILTITGTIGWEGAILRKPIITFGNVFYNSLPWVSRCTEIEKLPSLINERINNSAPYDEEEMTAFLAAIFEDSAHVDLQYFWIYESDFSKKKAGIAPLADLLAKKLNLCKVLPI